MSLVTRKEFVANVLLITYPETNCLLAVLAKKQRKLMIEVLKTLPEIKVCLKNKFNVDMAGF